MNAISFKVVWKGIFDSLDARNKRTGYVVTGMTPSATGAGSLGVTVASGTYVKNSETATTSYAGGAITLTAANGTNPRVDIVYMSSGGTLSKSDGTAAAIVVGTSGPVPVAWPAGSTPLAICFVPALSTDFTSGGYVGDVTMVNQLRATFAEPVLEAKSANVASATPDLSTATGNEVHITGTSTITSLGTVQAGTVMRLVFEGLLKVTYNATSLILCAANDFYSQVGDSLTMLSEGSGNWREIARMYASAAAVSISGNLATGVALNNASNYFDGATVSLVAGRWFVVATATVFSTGGGLAKAKIWDGTNNPDATTKMTDAAGAYISMTMSAIVSPTTTTTYRVAANHANVDATLIGTDNEANTLPTHIRAWRIA